MFTESLLESSNVARKHSDKRWPMTLAFVLESIAVSFLLLLPLASTGVIPVLGHVPLIAPVQSVEVEQGATSDSAGQRSTTAPTTQIVNVITNRSPLLPLGRSRPIAGPSIDPGDIQDEESKFHIGDLMCGPDCTTIARPAEPAKRVHLSHLSEATLVRKIDPLYPHAAVLAHISGAVQLHAFIGKDGTIQSLSVVSGNPLLAQAAVDAVRQWRYKPYMLNDEAVEVETFITVNFRGAAN
ncbi:MAG TPA: energy transducer TonB [Candidatus Angelobacter sp.]|nr:energy transducer TonB [Candidatus Angelobacter sp.]